MTKEKKSAKELLTVFLSVNCDPSAFLSVNCDPSAFSSPLAAVSMQSEDS